MFALRPQESIWPSHERALVGHGDHLLNGKVGREAETIDPMRGARFLTAGSECGRPKARSRTAKINPLQSSNTTGGRGESSDTQLSMRGQKAAVSCAPPLTAEPDFRASSAP